MAALQRQQHKTDQQQTNAHFNKLQQKENAYYNKIDYLRQNIEQLSSQSKKEIENAKRHAFQIQQ